MKKIYGFLTAAAILLTAACTQDLEEQKKVDGVKGDFFMSMNITQATSIGTRTATPNQGVEVGKDRENKVATAMIIFAEPKNDGSGDYTIFKKLTVSTDNLTPTSDNSNLAIFELDRKSIQDDIKGEGGSGSGEEKEYSIFVVANPTTGTGGIDSKLTEGGTLQQFFELGSDVDTYWSMTDGNGKFLMSNKSVLKKTIPLTEVETGKHTTETNALHLGTVEIQRAMSRFDIAFGEPEGSSSRSEVEGFAGKEYQKFQITNGNSKFNVTIELDGVALVNQATKVPLFKVTDNERGNVTDGYFAKKKMNFTDETVLNHVITPYQTEFLDPFFKTEGNAVVTNGKLTGDQINYSSLNYTAVTAITESDNTFTHEGSNAAPDLQNKYKIWRYCMENANAPETAYGVGVNNDNQVNGNSTGVAFRAKMTVTGTDIIGANAGKIYAYNSVILGNFDRLRKYVANNKQPDQIEDQAQSGQEPPVMTDNPDKDPGVYEMVQIQWNAALAVVNALPTVSGKYVDTDEAATEGKINWKNNTTMVGDVLTTFEADMRSALVKQNFTIYEPEADGATYYCYYIYWNRHNDNNDETLMAPMEFATVRNNVYKLRVTGINKLGHPGNPNDDPDPNKPDDPDEKDHLYMSVDCKVLPWEVRVNDIIF